MTEQERKLDEHYRDAIIAISVEIDRYKKSSGFADIVIPPLLKAREALYELYGDWLLKVKTPKEFTASNKAQWLRELAKEIEDS